MTHHFASWLALTTVCAAVFGCESRQYVNPDTVALVITNDTTSVQRLNRCNYVPVLLGSEVTSTYAVEGSLKATITLTRDTVSVSFAGGAGDVEPFAVPVTELVEQKSETAESPPAGYTVELSTGCTPDDP